MEFFGGKPKSKKIKRLNVSQPRKESNLLEVSQKSSQSLNDQTSSSLYLSQTKNNINSIPEMDVNIDNICNICYMRPKNGVFNHGKIGHIYCCYSCAKKLWQKSNKCPLCNVKIKFVTKMIVV